jgi:protein-disulfide isomerase
MRLRLLFGAFALSVPGVVGHTPAIGQATADWTRTVAATPEGGFRMGNPNAKVKLVEYGSLTCSHCADFSETASAPLKALVKSGKVSFEYRNLVLNGVDVTATLVARCGGASRFFPIAERLYATQAQWTDKISGLSQAEKDKFKGMSRTDTMSRIADIGGITQVAVQNGVSATQAKQCLADPAGLQRLEQMYNAASAAGVQSTPTFFLNGTRLDGNSWAIVQAAIRKAGG